MRLTIALLALMFPLASAAQHTDSKQGRPDLTLLPPLTPNVYGPSTGKDAAGQPFHWETLQGETVILPKVTPNAYGLGVGKDQYGRPVVPRKGFGK